MRQPYSLYPRIVKSGKKVWYYATWDGGTRVYRSTGCTTKSAALAEIKKRIEDGTLIGEGRSVYLSVFLDDMLKDGSAFLNDMERVGRPLTPQTLRAYRHSAVHLKDHFGNKRMADIEHHDLERYQDSMRRKGYSASTINLDVIVLKNAFTWAQRLGIVRHDPTYLLPSLKREEKGVSWTEEEVAKLVTLEFWDGNVNPWKASLICAYTGMRISEVIGLKWDDIHDGVIHVSHQIVQATGKEGSTKGKRDRWVPIPADVMEILLEYRSDDVYVIGKGKGPENYTSLSRAMRKARIKFGADCTKTFHSFRHYVNTKMVGEGVPETMIRASIGHASRQMTEHYYHGETSDMQEIKKVQQRIKEATSQDRTW